MSRLDWTCSLPGCEVVTNNPRRHVKDTGHDEFHRDAGAHTLYIDDDGNAVLDGLAPIAAGAMTGSAVLSRPITAEGRTGNWGPYEPTPDFTATGMFMGVTERDRERAAARAKFREAERVLAAAGLRRCCGGDDHHTYTCPFRTDALAASRAISKNQ